jgi:hypothetical protein
MGAKRADHNASQLLVGVSQSPGLLARISGNLDRGWVTNVGVERECGVVSARTGHRANHMGMTSALAKTIAARSLQTVITRAIRAVRRLAGTAKTAVIGPAALAP